MELILKFEWTTLHLIKNTLQLMWKHKDFACHSNLEKNKLDKTHPDIINKKIQFYKLF